MVNAADCNQEEILAGIRRGNFYATQGPDFRKIEYAENTGKVEASPVTYIRLIGPRRAGRLVHALGMGPICRTEFQLPAGWPYARLEIEGAAGKRALTNSLWLSY